MKQEWRKALVPGARVRITDTPSGLFDVGAVLVVDSVEDECLAYHYAEGVWIEKGGENFPLWEMFGGGECTLSAFGDGSVDWEILA
jgi:hypothetical protein